MIKRISIQMLTPKFHSSIPMKIRTVSSKKNGGFTLVELLTVLSITAILAVLTVPAMQGLQSASGFNKSVYAMADSLNLAHAYAIANNTYVYVGLTEVNRTQNPGASPQVAGVGRVALSIVATTDGTSDVGSFSTTGTNLTQVRQVQTFDFFHIASTVFPTTTTGNMARPTNVSTTPALIPAASAPGTPFSLPLGSTSGSGKYNFTNTNTQIVCFTPQGGVLLNGTAVQWLEIDVQPMVGTITPTTPANVNKGNQAALVIDGVTGALNVYRP
jgi:prepilin-type N-terminal cleavage/methylation domain-containing protein